MICPGTTNHWRCTYPPQSSGHCKGTSASGSQSWRDVAGTQPTHPRALGAARGPQDCAEDPGAGEGAGRELQGRQHGWLGETEAGGTMPCGEMQKAQPMATVRGPPCPLASHVGWGAGCWWWWWEAGPGRSPGSVRAPRPAGMAAPCLRRVKEAEEAGSGPSRSP